MALPGAPGPAPPPPTVLMAVRVGVPQPPRVPPPPAAALRLHLSVEPAPGGQRRFLLGLRQEEAAGGASIAEYDLKDISYTVRSPTRHELLVLGSLDEPMVFIFEEEREAQKWWTIVSSSLREVQKASSGSRVPTSQPSSPPRAPGAADHDAEEAAVAELSDKEELALQLASAIEHGDEDAAARCATALARQQATLSIRLSESCYPEDEICMNVGVEDATSSANVTLLVHPHTTIAALKEQVFRDYGFHPLLQRWIIGQCLCVDGRTVLSYGVRRDGDAAFLYLLSARSAELTPQRYQRDQARGLLRSAAPALHCGGDAGNGSSPPSVSAVIDPLHSLHIGDPPTPSGAASPPSPIPAGWACPQCTFINKPTRPGCEMCSAARPPEYIVPGGYEPDESERRRMRQEHEATLRYQQDPPTPTIP